MPTATPLRLSGLQRKVLNLYRDALRAARGAHLPRDSRAVLVASIVTETRAKAASVERLDYQRIEYLLRAGRKRIAALSATDGGITGVAWLESSAEAVPPSVLAMVSGSRQHAR